jgi:hypothetical protein
LRGGEVVMAASLQAREGLSFERRAQLEEQAAQVGATTARAVGVRARLSLSLSVRQRVTQRVCPPAPP